MSAFFIPKNLLGGDITEGRTQKLTFTLKRSRAAAATDRSLVAGLGEALTTLEEGLKTLAALDDRFENSAQIDFQFDLTREGKVDFVFRAGGVRTHMHTLSLTVQRISQA